MTREEAIKILKAIRVYECYPKSASEETKEAIDMAIETLSAAAEPQIDQYKKGFEDAKRAFLVEYARESENMRKRIAQLEVMLNAQKAISAEAVEGWIPVTERLPSKEEMKEWIDNNLDGIGYLYPCLVTRYSSINPGRTKCNPYVAKHYFDGEDFVNNGEEVCSEYIIAWMPLPTPYKGGDEE